MLDRTRRELALQLRVNSEVFQLLVINYILASQRMPPLRLRNARARAGCRITRIERIGTHTVAVNAVLRGFVLRITQVLAHGKGIVKFVVEAVSHHFLVTGISIILRAFVEVSWQTIAVRQRINRSLFWQPAVVARFRLVLEVREERESGFIIRTP